MEKIKDAAGKLKSIAHTIEARNGFMGLLAWIDRFRNAYIAGVKRRDDLTDEGKAEMIRDANRVRRQLRWQVALVLMTMAILRGEKDEEAL